LDHWAGFGRLYSRGAGNSLIFYRKLEWVVDDKATQIDGVIREGNGLRYLMGNLTRIFSSGNECAHTAVQHAVIQLLAGIKTEESNSITIKGEMLSRLVYEHFWRNLVAAQALHHAKRVKNISVYATHAASVGVWHSDEYSRL
jgi:hypothetical protein